MNTPQYQGPGPYNAPQHAVSPPPVPVQALARQGMAHARRGRLGRPAHRHGHPFQRGRRHGHQGRCLREARADGDRHGGRRGGARADRDQDGDRQAEADRGARSREQLRRGREYLVGEDIKAGTYKIVGSDGSFGCYWARLKNASGEFDAIIAKNNLEGQGWVTPASKSPIAEPSPRPKVNSAWATLP